MTGKLVLVRSRKRAVLARALEAGFTHFLLDEGQRLPGRADALLLRDGAVRRNGRVVGPYLTLRDRSDERRIRELKGRAELVVVRPTNWKVIPLENLVAALGGKTQLIATATTAAEARLFLGTLERGVDGVVIEPKSIQELEAYRPLLEPPRRRLRLRAATITRIEPLGLGERVCVDTCNVFEPGEGLLVGSTSRGFFLVAAECYETEYVAARPFRVNAGAVHAYLWDGDRTKYLSEVRAGVALEAVDAGGRRRPVVVGRAKVETRPLVLVEASAGRHRASVVLQNAETIRLVQPSGRAKSVARLKLGDSVLFLPETGARHFGMRIEERIREL